MTFAALYSSVAAKAVQPVPAIARFRPAFAATFLPGLSAIPFAERVMPLTSSLSRTTVPALSAILRLT